METMTANQKKFADEYIISGNATEAYKIAYGGKMKDLSARVNASQLLTKTNIQDYIKERNKVIESTKIATMTEIKEFWTSRLRDQAEDVRNSLKASEYLAKTNGAFLDKVEHSGGVGITVQWGVDDDDEEDTDNDE